MAPTDVSAVTAAGDVWKWQLRDKGGRWIQMGSEVSFSHNGKTFTGIIIGSPKPGVATVKLPDGSTMAVATAGVTSTGKNVGAAKPDATFKQQPIKRGGNFQTQPIGEGGNFQTQPIDASKGGPTKTPKAIMRPKPKPVLDERKKTKKKQSEKSGSGSSRGSNDSGSDRSSDGSEAPDDVRLKRTHRTSRSIEGLIRIRAREMGRKDPFGEQESDSKSKDGGSKNGKNTSAADGAGSGSSTTGSKKPRENTRKKLTQSQIDAVNVIMAAVLKHIKAGEYSTARGRLDAAKDILKDTSAPWLLKRIHFLRKGVGALEQGPVRASGMMLWAMETRLLAAITAAGESWQWQLRDKKGQWIEMGSRVSWILKGLIHTGVLIGSPKEGTARVRDDKDGSELNLPASSRLIALADIGSAVRHTPGGQNPKAVLGKVIGRPVDAKGREKKGRLIIRTLAGKEMDVNENTLTVLPLDSTREAVREYGGYSVKIDGTLPKTGYMAAQLEGSKQVTPEEFFGPDGEEILMNFMRDNAKQFKDDPEVYLGIWYDKDEKGQPPEPKVVIDVSHNIQDRDDAILTGRYQDQKSIWDVVRQEEIDTGGTGGYAKEVVRPSDEGHRPDVGRGIATLVPAGDSSGEGAVTDTVVDDRKWLRRPPPVGGLRIVDAKSSMTAHGPEAWKFINNDGGTLGNPRHLKESVMTVSMLEMADHFTEVLRAAQDGVPYSDRTDLAEMADAVHWYEMAHQTCLDLLADFSYDPKNPEKPYIPDLTIEKVTGVMAAMSPRMAWPLNIVAARKILSAEADPEFRKIPISQAKHSAEDILEATPELQETLAESAKDMTKAGNTTFAEDSLQILRGIDDPQEIMGGMKRRSFWNCMLDPSNTWDVCIDGWMISGTRRAGLTYTDGRPLDKKALPWLDDGKGQIKMDDSGAGYIIIADAIRVAAARVGITPLQAQALYWVSVGGGAKNAEMWTDPPGVSYTTRQDASKREARLAEELRPTEVPT